MSTLEIVLLILATLIIVTLAYLINKYKEKAKAIGSKVLEFSKKIDFKATYSNLEKSGLIDKGKQAAKDLTSKKE